MTDDDDDIVRSYQMDFLEHEQNLSKYHFTGVISQCVSLTLSLDYPYILFGFTGFNHLHQFNIENKQWPLFSMLKMK